MNDHKSSAPSASTSAIKYDDFEKMPQFQGAHANLDLFQGISGYGFEQPSEIQQLTIVPIYNGRNIIGQAQSGRGKTGAFVIGALSLLDPKLDAVQIIIISNTHELAQQTRLVVEHIGTRLLTREQVDLCVGQHMPVEDNIRHIREGCQVLIGTPGRIKHLVFHDIKGQPLIDPRLVKIVILDEADCLLMDTFRDDVSDIIDALDVRERAKPLQLAIFSATFSESSLEVARKLCVPGMDTRNDLWKTHPAAPLEVLVPVEELTLKGIEQFYCQIECEPKYTFEQKAEVILILNGMRMIPMCIIYVNSKATAERLKNFLEDARLSCQCIYGSMAPSMRRNISTAFRNGESRILIATDLLARGFDVQQVELVINFDLPYVTERDTGDINKEKMAEYLHRIGRGGRFGRRGVAISIVANAAEMSRLQAIRKYFSTIISPLPDDEADLATLY